MGDTNRTTESQKTPTKIAFISEGQLWIYSPADDYVDQIQSKFATKLKDDLLKIHQRNEWKNQGAGASFSGSGAMWATSMFDPSSMTVAFTALAGDPNSDAFYYVIQTADICGLFRLDPTTGEEQRLFHGADKSVHALDPNPDDHSLVCSISSDVGLHNLALFRPGRGGGLQEITEGDSLDAYPKWVPGKQQVVFQTAGIGRNRYGDWVETAPCEVALLDFVSGDIQTILSDKAHDFLLPQMDKAGNLYCIRRPYSKARSGSPLTQLWDLVTIPFRLLKGIFGFLDFFTSVFTGKPLTSTGQPRSSMPDAKRLVLYGNLVDAEKVAKENANLAEDEPNAGIPRSWELVCFPQIGSERVIYRGVMSFSLSKNGTILISNGRSILETKTSSPDKPKPVTRQNLVQQIVAT